MIYSKEYLEFRPDAKTEDWGNRLISYFRLYWQPVVDPTTYNNNMALVLSRESMADIANMFKDPKNLGYDFIPIAIMEKVRNVLFGERLKAGLSATVKAVDPAAEKDSKDDRNILKNRKEFEQLVNFMHSSIGMPQYSIDQEAKTQTQTPFKGNVEMFDELGLNSNNEQDLSYFFRTHYKLLYEMDCQAIVNAYVRYNEMEEYLEDWCNDILAVKTIGGRVYVNKVTGAMDYSYYAPDKIKRIPGRRKDSKHDICVGFEDSATVADAIAMIGDNFNYEEHMGYLVNAVNFFNMVNLVEITDGGQRIYGREPDQRAGEMSYSYDQFAQMKVGIGYIEWKAIDAVGYKIGHDFAGNAKTYKIPFDQPVDSASPYQKEVRHKSKTYQSHYIQISSNQQILFGFGPLYHQTIEGAEDEYSNYSIFYKAMTGPSVAEVCRPWIKMGQEIFYKMKWMVRKAKPKGRSYSYESLVKMAKHMFNEGNLPAKVTQLIKMFEEGINEMFTYPEINGEKMGGGQNPNADLPNGLDKSAVDFKGLLEWVYQMIAGDLGTNDIRTGQQMDPNSGYRLQMQSLEQSRNATQYLNYMIDSHAKEASKRFLLTGQDIIRYKASSPYKFLADLVGMAVVTRLGTMLSAAQRNKAIHRYAIFVHSLSTYNERQEIKQAAYLANQKGEIPYEVLLLIIETEDYKKAAYILSYEKKRGEALLQQQKMQEQQAQQQLSQQQFQQEAELEKLKGQNMLNYEKTKGYFNVMVQLKDNEGKQQVTQQKLDAKPEEQQSKSDANTQEYANKKTIDSQHSLPA